MREVSEDGAVPRGDLGILPTVHPIAGPKTVPRVDYERIFALDASGKLLGEYVLNDECPLEFADLQRSIPVSGMRHLVAFYQGDYAFTPFRVDDLWFVVLTLGVPRIEDRGSIGTLLAAARVHIVPNLEPTLAQRDADIRQREIEIGEREARINAREQRALQVEGELQIVGIRLNEFEAELRVRESKIVALRDYALRLQTNFGRGAAAAPPAGPEMPAAPKAPRDVSMRGDAP